MNPDPRDSTESRCTTRSGNADMNPRASALIACRPTEGGAALMVSEPSSAKNDATFAGSWLHQAAVYRVANACALARSLGHPPRLQAVEIALRTRSTQAIQHGRDDSLRAEVIFDGSHRAHRCTAHVDRVERARAVARAAAVVADEQPPRRSRISHETESVARRRHAQGRARRRIARHGHGNQRQHCVERILRDQSPAEERIEKADDVGSGGCYDTV